MKQLDLDDLPPRIAQLLAELGQGEELVLVKSGAVVGRLQTAEPVPPKDPGETLGDLSAEEQVSEVFEHFNSMIQDEF